MTGFSGPIELFFEKTETFFEGWPLENTEAQASITVYLFSFNSGRVTRRSGPSFLREEGRRR